MADYALLWIACTYIPYALIGNGASLAAQLIAAKRANAKAGEEIKRVSLKAIWQQGTSSTATLLIIVAALIVAQSQEMLNPIVAIGIGAAGDAAFNKWVVNTQPEPKVPGPSKSDA